VWTNHGDDVFQRGDRMVVFFETDVDAYVALFRLDADGNVRLFFPRSPGDDNFARGGVTSLVRGAAADHTLRVEEYPGEGYLFGVATLDPITLGAFAREDGWDYEAMGAAARVTGDPYEALDELLAVLIPAGYEAYGFDVRPYSVAQPHDYPRFRCYQCHAYVSPAAWDPYAHSCIRLRTAAADWWDYVLRLYPRGAGVGLPPGSVTRGGVGRPGRGDGTVSAPRARQPDPPGRRGTVRAPERDGRRRATATAAAPASRVPAVTSKGSSSGAAPRGTLQP
jgi:hypothetical protein